MLCCHGIFENQCQYCIKKKNTSEFYDRLIYNYCILSLTQYFSHYYTGCKGCMDRLSKKDAKKKF